jgi:hypothetical protein
MTISRVSDAFSPFTLTPFAMTGQPGSSNHQNSQSSSTQVYWQKTTIGFWTKLCISWLQDGLSSDEFPI